MAYAFYHHEGVLVTGLSDAYATTTAHGFQVHDLPAGARVLAQLWWETGDDMRVVAARPGGSCQVTPAPDLDCIVGGRVSGVSVPPACPARASRGDAISILDGQGHREIDFVADVKGTWTVLAHHAAGPSERVPYHLRIEVHADGWQSVTGPVRGGWVNTDAPCWAPSLG